MNQKKNHFFSRIHVEDIANVLSSSLNNFKKKEIYNISDNLPASAEEVAMYGVKLLGIDKPKTIEINEIESGETLTYSLGVDETHNHFANSLLVHNAAAYNSSAWAAISQVFSTIKGEADFDGTTVAINNTDIRHMSAGVFDRAERIFHEAVEIGGNDDITSLRGLLAIYQQEIILKIFFLKIFNI